MKYFASYTEVFGNDASVKRESLRLQTYNMAVHFLTRKDIEGNPICEEFKKIKAYFQSKEFTDVYFLSPYIFNENRFVKDMIGMITSSGETNHYNEIINEIKEEMAIIKTGRNFQSSQLIKVQTADEYLEKYYADPHSLNQLELSNQEERNILAETVGDGYKENDPLLSVLYIKLKIKNARNKEEIKEAISEGIRLSQKDQENIDLRTAIAAGYENQNYQESDKYREAFRWYESAAEKNDSSALYMEGLYYFLGTGVKKDREKAASLWTKAASMNNPDAKSGLGVYYLSVGDKKTAKKWLTESAEKGDYKALLLLDTDFDRK
jgi:hypothetical protein